MFFFGNSNYNYSAAWSCPVAHWCDVIIFTHLFFYNLFFISAITCFLISKDSIFLYITCLYLTCSFFIFLKSIQNNVIIIFLKPFSINSIICVFPYLLLLIVFVFSRHCRSCFLSLLNVFFDQLPNLMNFTLLEAW